MDKKPVTKIEGHATFYTHLTKGQIDKAKMIGLDGERFVEKILLGRRFNEAPIITSRICGICPVVHNVTSTYAMEDALRISVSEQVHLMRRILLYAQMIQSHALHLYVLVAPDFLGTSSAFELSKNHPEILEDAIELKKFADEVILAIGGRATHPMANVVGGFKSFPEKKELSDILKKEQELLENVERSLRLFASLKYPEVESTTKSVALYDRNHYAVSGRTSKFENKKYELWKYRSYVYEEVPPYSKAKFGTIEGNVVMVGSRARYNLSKDKLCDVTKKLVKELKIKDKMDNPYDNILAQAIEQHHFAYTILEDLKYLKENVKDEELVEPEEFAEGTGASEAPRGTLIHNYKVDDTGHIVKADIITPTVMNLPGMEVDMKLLGKTMKGMKKEEQDHIIETLIRAYDPCITCATH